MRCIPIVLVLALLLLPSVPGLAAPGELNVATEKAGPESANADSICDETVAKDHQACRMLTPVAISDLIAHCGSQPGQASDPVVISHAIVSDRLELGLKTSECDLVFADTKFLGRFIADDAHFKKGLTFKNVLFVDGLSAEDTRIEGSLLFENTASQSSFNVSSAWVGKSAVFKWLKIAAKDSHPIQAITARALQIEGDLTIQDAYFAGSSTLDEADVKGNLQINKSVFAGDLRAPELKIGRSLALQGTRFKAPVDITGLHAEHRVVVSDAHFESNIAGARLYVGDNLIVGTGSVAAGQTDDFHQSRIVGDFSIGEGGIRTMVAGNLKLALSHAGNVFFHNLDANDIDFTGISVDSIVDVAGTTLSKLDMTRASVAGDFRIAHHGRKQCTHWIKDSSLFLRYAKVGVIQDDQASEATDPWPSNLDLEGLSYDHFGSVRDGRWALRWLAKDASKAVSPYSQAENVFKNEGHPDFSDELSFRAKDLELQSFFEQCTHSFDLGNCIHGSALLFYREIAGYGVQSKAARCIIWIILLVSTGVYVLQFSAAAKARGTLWCFGASLSELIPIVDLNKEFKEFFFDPDRKRLSDCQLVYFGFHSICGYVLASFIGAAFLGITQ